MRDLDPPAPLEKAARRNMTDAAVRKWVLRCNTRAFSAWKFNWEEAVRLTA